MGVFSPGEREYFERGVKALESIAESLHTLAHPLYRVVADPTDPTGQRTVLEKVEPNEQPLDR